LTQDEHYLDWKAPAAGKRREQEERTLFPVINRREMLSGSAAMALQMGLIGSSWAQSSKTFTVPVIDRLTIRVLSTAATTRRARVALPG
jgi:hypothetical protein